jgi:NAD(P)-dependent dehydrogenase (short-subunit alcohol dehydrogenase family)
MKDVEGKVAFITGGSSGIGLGIAQAFTNAGMKVVIGYRSQGHLDEAMAALKGAGNRIHAIRVEVTDRPALERAAAETVKVFGKVHVLVNNAGIQNPISLGKMSYEEWDQMMSVNLDGVFNGVRAFLSHINAHGEGGHIVTTGSILGLFTVGAGYTAYCASKFAVSAMMESLRVELADANIGVSALCPGPVRSNLEVVLKDSPIALDPLEVGKILLQGIRDNDLYILTHPEYEILVQQRCEMLAAASRKAAPPSEPRRENARYALKLSIYGSASRETL